MLHDIIYPDDVPTAYGIEREKAYLRAFEHLSSPSSSSQSVLYSVCVSIISSKITKKDALKVKKRNSASVLSTKTMKTNRIVRGNHDLYLYNHIRFGVSYTIVSNKHTMVNLLQNFSYKTCKLLKLLSTSSSSPQKQLREDSGSSGGGMLDSPLSLSSSSSSLLIDSDNGLVLSCEDYFTSSSSSSSNLCAVHNDNSDHRNKNINNNNDNCRQSDVNVERLFDMYYIPHSNESTVGDETIKSHDTLSDVINKHLGHCDFSISTIVSSLSTRLLLQILMLVLVDKPIILLSSSCTLLTKVQHIIPRLIWPFRINTTHVMKQILNQCDLARFVIGNDNNYNDNNNNNNNNSKNKNVNNPYYLSSKYNNNHRNHHHRNKKQQQNYETNYDGKKSNWREMINQFASNVGSYLSTPKWGSVKYSKNANKSLSEITILKKSRRKSYHNSNGGGGDDDNSRVDRSAVDNNDDKNDKNNDDDDDMISNKLNSFYQLNDVSIDDDESKQSPSDDNNNNDNNNNRDGENRNRIICFSPDVTIDTEINNDDYDSQSDDDYIDDDDDDDDINESHSHHKRSDGTTSSSCRRRRRSNDEDEGDEEDEGDKSYIVGIESTVFYGASKELRHDLEDMRVKGGAVFTIIDIDSGILWVYL